MAEVTKRDNHFLAQMYLRQWADVDAAVETYRTVVSRPSVPQWRRHAVKGIGYREHLYAHHSFGALRDNVERWLAREIDDPAALVLARVAREDKLGYGDWRVLLRFFATSQVRTPASLVRRQEYWAAELPKAIESALVRATQAMERNPGNYSTRAPSSNPLGGKEVETPMRVRVRRNPDGVGGVVEAEVLTGRRLWLAELHRIATTSYRELHRFKWTILRAPEGEDWLTSDDPAVTANVGPDGRVGFHAGWRQSGARLFIALSPRHLLFGHVRDRVPIKFATADETLTRFVQRCIVMHAHRMVFGTSTPAWVAEFRPRTVNEQLFAHESAEWRKFDTGQTSAEQALEDDTTWGVH